MNACCPDSVCRDQNLCTQKCGILFRLFFLSQKILQSSFTANELSAFCMSTMPAALAAMTFIAAMHTSIQKCDRKSCRNYIYSESFFIRRNFPGKEGVCWRHIISTKPCVSIHTQATILFLNTFAGMIKEVYGN